MKKNTEHLIDAFLVRAAQNGDAQAFDQLLKRWQPKLVAYACSQLQDAELAQDASQDTLLKVSQTLSTLVDAQTFPKWIYQILHRRCVDHIRNLQRKRRYESEEVQYDIQQTESEPIDLHRAIQRLQPPSAQVIRLFYFEGFSALEIADILDIPTGTVKSRLFSARELLKTMMESHND